MTTPGDALFEAVRAGDDAEVARLLRETPDMVRARIERDRLIESIPHWLYVGDTVLHLAAAALRATTARRVLDSGADPNAENRRGATPLHYACDARPASGGVWDPASQAAIVDLLVQRGADLEHVDRGGVSALHRAVRARSALAVRHLLDAGARIDGRLAKGGSTALHLAVRSTGAGGTAGAIAGQLEIIALLLEHGADPATPDAMGKRADESARSDRIRAALHLRQERVRVKRTRSE